MYEYGVVLHTLHTPGPGWARGRDWTVCESSSCSHPPSPRLSDGSPLVARMSRMRKIKNKTGTRGACPQLSIKPVPSRPSERARFFCSSRAAARHSVCNRNHVQAKTSVVYKLKLCITRLHGSLAKVSYPKHPLPAICHMQVMQIIPDPTVRVRRPSSPPCPPPPSSSSFLIIHTCTDTEYTALPI